jgi:hypothetical protein
MVVPKRQGIAGKDQPAAETEPVAKAQRGRR